MVRTRKPPRGAASSPGSLRWSIDTAGAEGLLGTQRARSVGAPGDGGKRDRYGAYGVRDEGISLTRTGWCAVVGTVLVTAGLGSVIVWQALTPGTAAPSIAPTVVHSPPPSSPLSPPPTPTFPPGEHPRTPPTHPPPSPSPQPPMPPNNPVTPRSPPPSYEPSPDPASPPPSPALPDGQTIVSIQAVVQEVLYVPDGSVYDATASSARNGLYTSVVGTIGGTLDGVTVTDVSTTIEVAALSNPLIGASITAIANGGAAAAPCSPGCG